MYARWSQPSAPYRGGCPPASSMPSPLSFRICPISNQYAVSWLGTSSHPRPTDAAQDKGIGVRIPLSPHPQDDSKNPRFSRSFPTNGAGPTAPLLPDACSPGGYESPTRAHRRNSSSRASPGPASADGIRAPVTSVRSPRRHRPRRRFRLPSPAPTSSDNAPSACAVFRRIRPSVRSSADKSCCKGTKKHSDIQKSCIKIW